MLPKEFEENVLGDIEAENGGDLEILGLDACLMGSAEVAYQFRNHVQYFIGSEETEAASGWSWEDVCKEFTDHPTLTTAQLANAVVDQREHSAIDTLSATCLSAEGVNILDLRTAVEALAAQLRSDSYKFPCHVARARENTKHVHADYTGYTNYSYISLYDYCKTLREELDSVSGGTAIREKAEDVMDLIYPCSMYSTVLENSTSVSYAEYKGLTVSYSMLTFRADELRAGSSVMLQTELDISPVSVTT